MRDFEEKSEKKCEILAKIKKSNKKYTKNGGFEWYRRLGKNAYKTTKYLPYGMPSA